MKKLWVLFTVLFFVAGCQTVPPAPEGFETVTVETEHFSFRVFQKPLMPGKPIRFYIEGDGTPNPKEFTALQLAQKDPYENVVYLSRPCQFIDSKVCTKSEIYTSARFHEEIVKEMMELVIFVVKKNKPSSIEFIGYDGGATMAMLLSTRVPGVTRVVTIAGILDTSAYTTHNNLPQLTDSLNPADERAALGQIPQIHYVGGRDDVTTRRMAERFVARLYNPRSAVVKVVPSADHDNWNNIAFDYY